MSITPNTSFAEITDKVDKFTKNQGNIKKRDIIESISDIMCKANLPNIDSAKAFLDNYINSTKNHTNKNISTELESMKSNIIADYNVAKTFQLNEKMSPIFANREGNKTDKNNAKEPSHEEAANPQKINTRNQHFSDKLGNFKTEPNKDGQNNAKGPSHEESTNSQKINTRKQLFSGNLNELLKDNNIKEKILEVSQDLKKELESKNNQEHPNQAAPAKNTNSKIR